MKNKKGFTLVELLVVIAIIGILSSVAVVNLNSARDKAKVAAMRATMDSLMPLVTLCHDDAKNLGAQTANATGGGNVCSGVSTFGTWPAPSQGYSWNNANTASNYSNGTFSFAVNSSSGLTNLVCTQAGCANY